MLDRAVLIIDADEARRTQLKRLVASAQDVAVRVCGPHEWRYQMESAGTIQTVLLGPCPRTEEQLAIHEALREWRPHLPVLLYHAPEATIPLDIELATAFFARVFEWPIKDTQLGSLLRQAYEYVCKQQPAIARSPELFRALVGKSEGIQQVRELIDRVSNTDATVLILGESGTGKEVVARNLHYHSPRRGKAFIAIDCGAIPAELLERELFGYEKGAFAGADEARGGRLEMAEGGTLFLDEIGDLSAALQVKLLRVLEQQSYERVGGSKPRTANVRIIAATQRDVERGVMDKRLREDLYYRLSVFPIRMPPLRERTEDIPLLIAELNARLMRERGVCVRLAAPAMDALLRYRWPGNVRELANLIERLAILHPNSMIELNQVPPKYREARPPALSESGASAAANAKLPPGGLDLKEHLNNIEYSLIMQALSEAGGVVAHAAHLLKLPRTTLVEKLRKYGVRGDAAEREKGTAPSSASAA